MKMTKYNVFTLFPETINAIKDHSILKRAIDAKIIEINAINFRNYTENKHNKVDDIPYGGGAGMVLMAQPIVDALKQNKATKTILLSPQGKPFTQHDANQLSKLDSINFVCGHYEGFDQRIEDYIDQEYSIGDFVLTGGELGAMVMIDAIARLKDGVIKGESHQNDSFQNGLLEHPHFTRPVEFEGKKVPEVLMNGNHKEIDKWRRQMSLLNTYKKRPDLLEKIELSQEDKEFLDKNK